MRGRSLMHTISLYTSQFVCSEEFYILQDVQQKMLLVGLLVVFCSDTGLEDVLHYRSICNYG